MKSISASEVTVRSCPPNSLARAAAPAQSRFSFETQYQ
jgi:hypothetical protein